MSATPYRTGVGVGGGAGGSPLSFLHATSAKSAAQEINKFAFMVCGALAVAMLRANARLRVMVVSVGLNRWGQVGELNAGSGWSAPNVQLSELLAYLHAHPTLRA